MKTRSSSGVGQKVDLEFDVDTLKISDLMEDDDTGSGFKKPGEASSIYDKLKKTSTIIDQDTGEIKPDPTEGINVGKIKSVAGSSKVRQLLAGINPEKD